MERECIVWQYIVDYRCNHEQVSTRWLVGPQAEGKEKKTKGEAAATKLGWTKLQKPAKPYIIFVKFD